MAGIHFNITGDNSNFLKKLREAEEGVKNTSKQIEQSGMGIEDLFNRMTQAAAAFGTGFAVKDLISNIMQVRGEFQQLEVAFTTMLGSEEKALSLMNQLVNTAATTPFGLQDVSNGAKQLLAYGTAAEEVNETIVRLGDIAAGLSIPLNDLVYLYGTTMTQGRMFTQDLRQFMGRGVPLAEELAKQFGVTKAEVGELVTAGKVGAAEFQKAIWSMTNEGSKFGGLTKAQAKTITGQISNIEDAIDTMLNKIGQSSEGIINESLSGVSYLVENYEKVGQVLIGLVATYGAYRAAVMAVVALNNLRIAGIAALTVAERAHYGLLVLTTAAQKALNAAMLTNPYVLLATAVVGVGAAMWAMADKTTAAEKALKRYNDAVEGINQKEDERKRKVEEAVRVLQSEVEAETTKVRALNTLKELYPDLADKYEREKGLAGDLTAEWKAYNEQTSIRVRQAKEARLAEIEQEISGKQMIYNVEERLGNRSAMKRVKSDISVLQKEAAKYRQDILASINLELEAEDNNKSTASNLYQKDLATAKEAWVSAKKGYESLIKDQNATTEQVKEAKKLLDEKAAAYKDLGGDTTGKASQNALKQQEQIDEEMLQLRRDNQQAEIDLMIDGENKKLAQIDLNYQKELDKVKELRAKWMKEQGGLLTSEQSDQLFNMGRNAYLDREASISNVKKETNKSELDKVKEEIKAMNDYFIAYGELEQKRQAILDNAELEKEGKNEWEIKSIDARTKKELEELEIQAAKTSTTISNLFDDMSDKTVKELRKIAEEGRALYDFLKGGEWDAAKGLQFGITESEFNAFRNSTEEMKNLKEGVEGVEETADNAETAFQGLGTSIKDLFKSKPNTEGFEKALDKVMSKVQQITELGDFLSGVFSNLGMGGIAEGLDVATNALGSAMQGAQAGSMFGPIGAAAGAALGAVSSLESSIAAIHDKKNERRIQNLQEQIETLKNGYDKLGKSVEEAFSKDASGLIEEQNKLLQQQKVLTQQQIREEEDKKKTDNNRIKEWQQQIEDINGIIEENKEKAVDAIFGEDLKSAIENFADAYANAWANGEDKAKSARDTVKKMMQQMVTESIKAAIQSSGKMEEIRRKLQEFYADNVLSGWEQDYIYKIADDLQRQLDEQFGWADGLMGGSEAQQEASSKGYESMSQETGEELNGRFTALQISNEEIKNQMIAAVVAIQSITAISSENNTVLNAILTQHVITNSHLEDVVKYTKLLNDIKADISYIKINGVKTV